MKILGEDIDTQENILKLVNKSNPTSDFKLEIIDIKDKVGWVSITAKINESDFFVDYSSAMFDSSILIRYLAELINITEETVLFLDNEGSFPMFYANKIDDNTIRFLFAHDYILFENDEIDDDCLPLYKIECDILINKKTLLEKFYNILYPFTENYNLEEAYGPTFNLENGKKYLSKIKTYISDY